METFAAGLLEGKNAFVAGGTSGINLGIAKRFHELGASVTVLGRNMEKALAAAASIGPGANGLAADVREYGEVRGALEAAAAHSPLDIVVSGAAGNFLAPACELSSNGFSTVVNIDLVGTFNVFRASYDLMRKPGASLIAISAGQAVNAMALQAHACAAKAGINQLVRVLALEWGPDCRVNGISPGPIEDTEGMDRLVPDTHARQAHFDRIPLKRWGKVSEVADCAVFLCSPAAAYISGTIIDCDGASQIGDASRGSLADGL